MSPRFSPCPQPQSIGLRASAHNRPRKRAAATQRRPQTRPCRRLHRAAAPAPPSTTLSLQLAGMPPTSRLAPAPPCSHAAHVRPPNDEMSGPRAGGRLRSRIRRRPARRNPSMVSTSPGLLLAASPISPQLLSPSQHWCCAERPCSWARASGPSPWAKCARRLHPDDARGVGRNGGATGELRLTLSHSLRSCSKPSAPRRITRQCGLNHAEGSDRLSVKREPPRLCCDAGCVCVYSFRVTLNSFAALHAHSAVLRFQFRV